MLLFDADEGNLIKTSSNLIANISERIDETKNIVNSLKETRRENLELEEKTAEMSAKFEALKLENKKYVKFLDDKRDLIENNILDLFQYYEEKERNFNQEKAKILEELGSQKFGENLINFNPYYISLWKIELKQSIEKKRLENEIILEDLSKMEIIEAEIKQQDAKLGKMRIDQDKKNSESDKLIYELVEKLAADHKIDEIKSKMKNEKQQIKIASMNFIDKEIRKTINENSVLRSKHARFQNQSRKIENERDLIFHKKIELQRAKKMREKLIEKLEQDSYSN